MGRRQCIFSCTLRRFTVLGMLACLAILICSSSLAYSYEGYDINFRDIPWFSSEEQVIEALQEQGIITEEMDIKRLRRDLIQDWLPFTGCEYPNGTSDEYSSYLVYEQVPQTDYFF